jgi:MFS transporter, ACS family, hexuronate transporter
MERQLPLLLPDRRAFGLAVMTLGSSIGPAVFAPLLTFVIVMLGWRTAFALLGIIGVLWVVIWLVVARERPAEGSISVHEAHVARQRIRWSQVLPLIFSRNIIFSILAAFSVYWGTALLLSWTPVYLVSVLHLKLTDPLYIAGVSLPWIFQGLFAFGALADRAFRLTGSVRWSRVLLVAAIVLDVTPEANRGSVQGVVVAFSTLPGFFAPFITGVLIQATGNQVAIGLHNAYVLAALLLLVGGVGSMLFVRPDEAMRNLSTASGN